ncbi:MAG TPA: neutral zinc metallopeptidase [Gammaproteobacteria bacterium]|nr:neutral zinc metallopeptidase [Gammaproteobacteria bacterium]
MKWQRARRSDNVEDRRRMGGLRGAGGLGLGGIAVVVVIGLLLGKSPGELLGLVSQLDTQVPGQSQTTPVPGEDPAYEFIAAILGETEDVWTTLFTARGARYEPPRLVLFSNYVNSACGGASAAVGPFYCPGDRQVYIDLIFFREMEAHLGGGGEFAEAYVIAHEVGHHIQTLTGVSRQLQEARGRGEDLAGAEGLLVRQELQADCYAGAWAHHAQARHDWLEPGDIEAALNTASAIGDDRLQRQAQGTVVPDAFTHGTSAQRVRWFRRGFNGGDPAQCDTFAAGGL